MYQISEISTNLFKMYEYAMYCKMLGLGRRSILTKKNVCKSLVEPRCAILVRFSIFSIQLRFIVRVLAVPTYSSLLVLEYYKYSTNIPVGLTVCLYGVDLPVRMPYKL